MPRLFPLLVLLASAGPAPAYEPPVHFVSPDGYVSPFTLRLQIPERQRVAGWDRPPWNSVHRWGVNPDYAQWYRPGAYGPGNRPWGPASAQMPAPENLSAWSDGRLTERLLTAARQYIGMRYQHHHVPVFNPYNRANYSPPPAWPGVTVSSGYQGRGLDCSNFVSWVYNFALGIKLDGAVTIAAANTRVTGPGGRGTIAVQTIANAGQTYDELVRILQPGDILYFHGDHSTTNITHSALWVGSLATDANGIDTYFVLDSTGAGTLDSAGVPIPDGAQLRPFNGRKNQSGHWYFRQFDHAHRIIPLINARPTLTTGRRVETRNASVRLHGAAASPRGIRRVEYRVEGAHSRVALGTRHWHFRVRLEKPRTTVRIRAIGGNDLPSASRTVHIRRR